MGFRTATAAAAEQALAYVDRFRPEIVLTDSLMPIGTWWRQKPTTFEISLSDT